VTGQVDVDPEALRQAGADLGQLAEQMRTELGRLQSTVTGSGNPWGGDEQGTLFGQVYGLALGKALEALDSYVEQVGYAGYGLMRQGQQDVRTDTDSAAGFNAIPSSKSP
jgi:uncharacterized protein YukE